MRLIYRPVVQRRPDERLRQATTRPTHAPLSTVTSANQALFQQIIEDGINRMRRTCTVRDRQTSYQPLAPLSRNLTVAYPQISS